MNIQVLHPNPAQAAPERLRSTPEVPEAAVNAVSDSAEAPGITAAANPSGAGEGGLQGELRDYYAPEEREEGAGLYRMVRDEEGNPVLVFDDPKAAEKEKAVREEEAEAEEKKAEEEKARTETTTINTDRVDREIEELKEEVEDLEQRLHYGGTMVDKEKVEQQLTFAKIELHLKDNDTYRRANAQVTPA